MTDYTGSTPPSNPRIGDTWNGQSWNGTAWEVQGFSSSGITFQQQQDDMKIVWFGDKNGKPMTSTVKDAADSFTRSIFDANSPNHAKNWAIATTLLNAGVFGKDKTFNDPQSMTTVMRRIFIDAADVYNGGKGKKVDPYNNFAHNQQVIAKFTTASNDVQTQINRTGFTDQQATVLAKGAFQAAFGRAPSDKETAAYKKALIKAAAAAPKITKTTKLAGGGTDTTSLGGFNLKAWSAGYMSGLLPKESKAADVQGTAGQYQDTVKRTLEDYGIKPDDSLVMNSVRYLMDGTLTQENFDQHVQGMAKAKYGANVAQAIDNGVTVRQLMKEYTDTYAQMMDKNSSILNVHDIAALATTDDKGQQRLLTGTEFSNKLRQDPSWSKTSMAKNEAYSLANSILSKFGLVK